MRLVFDQTSPDHPVSESVTTAGRSTDILVSNIGYSDPAPATHGIQQITYLPMSLNCILPSINFFSIYISFPALGLLDWANKSCVLVAVFLLGVSWLASVCQPRQSQTWQQCSRDSCRGGAGISAGAEQGVRRTRSVQECW